MKILFTKHFFERYEFRKEGFKQNGIASLEQIKNFILDPDLIIPDNIFEEREWRIKKINKKCLKIVVEKDNDL